jgi:hypothetical protein
VLFRQFFYWSHGSNGLWARCCNEVGGIIPVVQGNFVMSCGCAAAGFIGPWFIAIIGDADLFCMKRMKTNSPVFYILLVFQFNVL